MVCSDFVTHFGAPEFRTFARALKADARVNGQLAARWAVA